MEGLHTLAVWYIPTKKSPIGSDKVKVEAILFKHNTLELVAAIRPECTVGHLIPCVMGRLAVMLEPYIPEVTHR